MKEKYRQNCCERLMDILLHMCINFIWFELRFSFQSFILPKRKKKTRTEPTRFFSISAEKLDMRAFYFIFFK